MPEEPTLESLRDRLERLANAHLPPEDAALTLSISRPAVRLLHASSSDAGGDSRSHLGGAAALTASAEWPVWNGRPLSLLAVLDLEELRPFTTDLDLPETGLLNFFYDAEEQQSWGFEPEHREGWRVVWTSPQHARETPAPDDALTFPAIRLAARQTLTIPGWEEPAAAAVSSPLDRRTRPDVNDGARDEQWRDAFTRLQDEWSEVIDAHAEPNHQLGGWPRLLQAPIWRECQVVSQGVSLGSGRTDPRVAELEKGAERWRLLLQLDTDDDAGWMWGDVGTLFFAVRDDLDHMQVFDRSWMVFQCL